MSVLFAAGDPGGSRVLLPVLHSLAQQNIPCRVVDNGFLAKELPEYYHHLLLPQKKAFVENPRCFVFGSSVRDSLPLSLARKAALKGIPTVHVLDNWASYKNRMETDGGQTFLPTVYAVMDEIAHEDVVSADFAASSVVTTGHPALGSTIPAMPSTATLHKKQIAFINEPFSTVLGSDIHTAEHCGFLEQDVFKAFADAMQPYAKELSILVVPHPKDDIQAVEAFWRNIAGDLEGYVQPFPHVRSTFPDLCGVAGMASLVLYEAWLFSLPVLAMQPDCKMKSMTHLSRRSDIVYADAYAAIPGAVGHWWNLCKRHSGILPRKEWELHKSSAARLAAVILNTMHGSEVR